MKPENVRQMAPEEALENAQSNLDGFKARRDALRDELSQVEGGLSVDRQTYSELWRIKRAMENGEPIDPRAAELEQVQAVALDVIARVMKEGEATHAVGEWRGELETTHEGHAHNHMRKFIRTGDIADIEHAIVRLLFIVAKAKQGEDAKLGSSKEDGK